MKKSVNYYLLAVIKDYIKDYGFEGSNRSGP